MSNVGHFKEVSSSERRIRRFGQKFDGHNMHLVYDDYLFFSSCFLSISLLWAFFERTDLFEGFLNIFFNVALHSKKAQFYDYMYFVFCQIKHSQNHSFIDHPN